ncbi:MAG: DUF3375 family protein, partial [Bdellovibrionales bacterium]|nr:DUF3375 family protein [Bdellovibrionales bacterium]
MLDNTRDLTFSKLRFLSKESPAVRLLRAENMAFVASFLYREFRKAEKHRIPESELRLQLAQYIEYLDADAPAGDAKYYLDQWAGEDHGYIRRFYVSGEEDAAVELTSETIR